MCNSYVKLLEGIIFADVCMFFAAGCISRGTSKDSYWEELSTEERQEALGNSVHYQYNILEKMRKKYILGIYPTTIKRGI